ncbi:OprD family porin [Pseudomonas sp. B21-054]|uniref:OprD family porin n=1 Tax=Pseudomonas sp. B21-054 TaxID=2895494 RepID=UPI0022328B14|nr:OprD family porin [Pseudomonas sp. B21-054]UZE20988.1 OprD family porin [Pseudomonas sp. B21-054]
MRFAGILLCVALSSPRLFAEGLVDDSKATLTLRNFFFERHFTAPDAAQDHAREWTQSFIFDLRSGFTSGAVGFGADILGKYAVKLDGGAGRYGALLLPKDGDGEPASSFGRLGVALKARISATELKAGEWMPNLPIVTADDFRALPQTFEGTQLSSQDVKNWTLFAGQLNKTSLRNDSSMEDLAFGSARSDAFNYLGADYRSASKNTTVRLWSGQLEDIYQQHYVGLNQRWSLSPAVALNTNLGYFWGKDDGAAKAGRLDNRTASLLVGLGIYQHTFSLGLQQVSGETGWMRIAGTGGIYLANNTFNHAFDNPRERSWQLRYDLDFAGYGVPGLSLMTRYVHGDDVRLQNVQDGSEWVRESELGYVVQSGSLKNLALRWRNASVRRGFNSADYDENRLIVSYPIGFL